MLGVVVVVGGTVFLYKLILGTSAQIGCTLLIDLCRLTWEEESEMASSCLLCCNRRCGLLLQICRTPQTALGSKLRESLSGTGGSGAPVREYHCHAHVEVSTLSLLTPESCVVARNPE